jgi:hypothetical protein
MIIDDLLHESNVIEGFDDLAFDKQARVAWDYLLAQDKLSIPIINRIQKLMTLKQPLQPNWRGYIRDIPVYIGNQHNHVEAMKPEFIKAALQEWIKLEPTMDPKHAHILYESIHPHVDGNGRTGRVLMWWRELKLKRPYTEIVDEDKWEYYLWFKPGYEQRQASK